MEAARVYESAHGNSIADALVGTTLSAIETGTFSRPASILIRSGSTIVRRDRRRISTEAAFDSSTEMREWIRDLDPELTRSPDWPTAESHAAWEEFTNRADQFSSEVGKTRGARR